MKSTFFSGKPPVGGMPVGSTPVGGTPVGTLVRVELSHGFLEIYNEQGQLEGTWEAEKTSRVRGQEKAGEFCLTLGGTARLVLRDVAIQQALSEKEVQSFLPKFLRGDGKVIGYTSLVVVVLGAFLWWGSSITTRILVDFIPESLDEEMGSSAFAAETGNKEFCENKKGLAALATMKEKVLGAEFADVKIVVVRAKEENAGALPGGNKDGVRGGYVIFFSGLLNGIHDQRALAGILAHEAGHIVHRHGMQRLVSVATFAAIATVFFGDFTGLSILFLEAGTGRNTNYMERQADEFALHLMNKKNIDTTPMSNWFMKRVKKEGEKDIFSSFYTHPHSSDRALFFNQSSSAGSKSFKPLTAEEWVALKNICS